MFSNSDRIGLDFISGDKFAAGKVKHFTFGQLVQRNTVNTVNSQDEAEAPGQPSGYSADGLRGLRRDFQTGTLVGS